MRISDWSSDVCSSDLLAGACQPRHDQPLRTGQSRDQAKGAGTGGCAGGEQRTPFVETGCQDRKSTRLKLQSLMRISYAVFCLKKKKKMKKIPSPSTYYTHYKGKMKAYFLI